MMHLAFPSCVVDSAMTKTTRRPRKKKRNVIKRAKAAGRQMRLRGEKKRNYLKSRSHEDISPSQGQPYRSQLKSRVLLMFLWGNPIRSQLHSRYTIPDNVCLTSQSRAAVKPNP